MGNVKKRYVPVTNVYPPEKYSTIEPGSVLLSLPQGKLWRAIDVSKSTLSIIPYSGGERYDIPTDTGLFSFGLIEDPSALPETLYLSTTHPLK